jgi:AAA family ATP:ADP antiporter
MNLKVRDFILHSVSYFFLLLSYPLIRASSTAYFFEAYGAKSTPLAWLWAIMILSICVWGLNLAQKKRGSWWLMSVTSLFSSLIFFGCWLLYQQGFLFGAYGFFVWKEVYIVLLVHLMLAYINSLLSREHFKKRIGIIAGAGSLGGILGGLLTTQLSQTDQTNVIFLLGVVFILVPGLMTFLTPNFHIAHENHPSTAFASLDNQKMKKYVFFIIVITILSQWIINIADFKFNLVFEKSILSSQGRTAFLGQIYTYTNLLTLGMQLLILPVVLRRLKEKSIHLMIPIFYFISFGVGLFFGQSFLLVSSGFYLFLKSVDYSLFSGAKEFLYQPMDSAQKYATKYLTDMIAYRGGKGCIALILVYTQNPQFLNLIMLGCMGIWIGLLFPLFKLHQELFSLKE